jgi:hypothetical protein
MCKSCHTWNICPKWAFSVSDKKLDQLACMYTPISAFRFLVKYNFNVFIVAQTTSTPAFSVFIRSNMTLFSDKRLAKSKTFDLYLCGIPLQNLAWSTNSAQRTPGSSQQFKGNAEIVPLNSMVWIRERTIPTERPPLVSEVIANFCG